MTLHWSQKKERGNLLGYKIMRAVALVLGCRLTELFLWPITLYYYLTARAGREALGIYYHRLGKPATTAVIFRHYFTFAQTILHRVYLLSRRPDAPALRVRGFEAVQAELDRQKGCVLLGAHLGSFEAARAAGLRKEGITLQVIMEEKVSRKLNRALSVLDPGAMDTIVGLGSPSALFQVRDTIVAGGVVGMMGDRVAADEEWYEAEFLGRKCAFPLAPLRLAATLRAPVFFFSALYRSSVDGSPGYEVVFERLAAAAPEGRARSEWLRNLGARYVSRLERYCRAAPNNWFNFYDFWSTHAVGGSGSDATDSLARVSRDLDCAGVAPRARAQR